MKANKFTQVILFLSLVYCGSLYSENWQNVSSGLEYGRFELAVASISGDSHVDIIRIDPKLYDFELLLASEQANQNRTIDKWVQEFKMTGGINAGMFQKDYSTGTGYLVNYQHKNNPSRHSAYNMYFVCNPKEADLPEAQMIDWQQPGAPELIAKYHSALQCIRMMATGGINVWSQQTDKWSEAALGQDTDGNILFIICCSPYTMYDLVNLLKQLPLNLDKMMHLEGGPEASLYIDTPILHLERNGTYETHFKENTLPTPFWQIPNVIGFKGK